MAVTEAFNLPPPQALKYLEARGANFRPSYGWRQVYGEAHSVAFTVAQSAYTDILSDIHQGLLEEIRVGGSAKTFADKLRPLLMKKGWWGKTPEGVQLGSDRRLRIIFDTNLRVSYAASRWERIQRTKKAFPYLRYVAVLDSRTRPLHRHWHGTIFPVNNAWWDTHAPPNGWRCRCQVQQLSERQARNLGFDPDNIPPPPDLGEYYDAGLGRNVPLGIDKGWGYNPGRANYEATQFYEKITKLPPRAAADAFEIGEDIIFPRYGEEYGTWSRARLSELKDDKAPRSKGERRVVGVFDHEVQDFLEKQDIELKQAAFSISDYTLFHLARDSKQARSAVLPDAEIENLPARLIDDTTITLFDTVNQAIIYAWALDEENWAKVAIKANRPVKRVRKKGEKSGYIEVNEIATAGIVRERDLNSFSVIRKKAIGKDGL